MLLRWNMLFFDFCVRYLRLFDCLSAGKTVLLEQCCRKNAKLVLPEQRCQNGAKLVLPEQRCQTCSKYGNPSHTWRISGSTRQHEYACKVFLLYCWIVEFAYQRLSANPQAAVLLKGFSLLSASNTRNIKATCYASSVGLRMQYFSECAIMLTV